MQAIEEFLSHEHVAVAGASRNPKKFGNVIFRELLNKGFQPVPLNPNAEELEGHKCYPEPASLPDEVQSLVLVTPPAQTFKLVQEAAKKGITQFWIQQGAENPEAIEYCNQNKLNCISGYCILMFIEPVGSFHKVHRFFSKLFGAYPK